MMTIPFDFPCRIPAFDPSRPYTPSALVALLDLYGMLAAEADGVEAGGCVDMLDECVDCALCVLRGASGVQPLATLAATVAELGRKRVVAPPQWVGVFLDDAIASWRRDPVVPSSVMVFPLLVSALLRADWSLDREAQTLIEACYGATLSGEGSVEDMHVAATCREYVDGYDATAMASAWDALVRRILTSGVTLSVRQTADLLESAREIGEGSAVSPSLVEKLTALLEDKARENDHEARARLVTLRPRPCGLVIAV